MKRNWIWVFVILLIAGSISGCGWLPSDQPQNQNNENILRTAQVIRGDLEITVAASGNIAVKKKADLRFNTSGTVDRVYVEVGEPVRKGQTLARLGTEDLENAVQQAEIALEQAQLNLDMLIKPVDEADLELAQLALRNAAQALEVARIGKQTAQADANATILQAQRARENAATLYRDAGGGSAKEKARKAYENAEEQEAIAKVNAELILQRAQDQWLAAYQRYQQAALNLETLESGPEEEQIQLAELQIAQAELNLEQAKENLSDAALTAPFDGTIAAVNIQQDVPPPVGAPTGGAALTLVDDSELYVEVTVDEIDIGKVSVEQEVDISLDAYPDTTLKGIVVTIAPAPTNIGGVVAYLLRVRILDTNGVEVREGMTASVIIRTRKIENTLLIPNWAVRTEQSSGETYAYCYCLKEGIPQRVDIDIGTRNETFTEVLSGLEENATVALVLEERDVFDFESGPPRR